MKINQLNVQTEYREPPPGEAKRERSVRGVIVRTVNRKTRNDEESEGKLSRCSFKI